MMLKSRESQTSVEVGMQGASEPCQEVRERPVEASRAAFFVTYICKTLKTQVQFLILAIH